LSREEVERRSAAWPGGRSPRRYLVAIVVAVLGAAGVWLLSQTRRQDRIVFVAERNGAWDLWWARGDGSGSSRLTSTPLDERAPALSPDRAKVAYSTSDGGLWVLNTSGRETERLPLEKSARHSNPSWSPDSRQMVFTTYTLSDKGEDATLWLYDVEQRAPRQLILQDGAQDFAKIHPDGGRIVYSSSQSVTTFGFGFVVIQQLWTMSLVTGRVEELVLARGKDTEPAWSPDGQSLVFVSDRGGTTQLWRVGADGGGLKKITEGPPSASHPAWSPDGAEIVFVASSDSGSSLAIVGADGGAARPLAIAGQAMSNIRDPHWR
jgi:Tol biopolymer transport system component